MENRKSDFWQDDEMYQVNGYHCVYDTVVTDDNERMDMIHLPGGHNAFAIDLISKGFIVLRPKTKRKAV